MCPIWLPIAQVIRHSSSCLKGSKPSYEIMTVPELKRMQLDRIDLSFGNCSPFAYLDLPACISASFGQIGWKRTRSALPKAIRRIMGRTNRIA